MESVVSTSELNLNSISYVAYRLAPFIIVSFFSLSSLLNQDLKGLIYLCGLLLTSFIVVIVGNSIPFEQPTNPSLVCSNVFSIFKTSRLSPIPLSQVVFSYTFGYLSFILFKYKLSSQNIPTLIIFPLLMIIDLLWILFYRCSNIFLTFFGGTVMGYFLGMLWSYIIDSFKLTKLQYFNGLSNREYCSVPKKQMFRCRPAKTPSVTSSNPL